MALHYVANPMVNAPAGTQTGAEADCPSGQHATGGGVLSFSGYSAHMDINSSSPVSNGAGWKVYVDNTDVMDHTMTVFAVCTTSTVAASPQPAPSK